MWDRTNSRTFTKVEAAALIGKTVNTSAGCKATIKGMFCEGKDRYTMVDEQGNMLYKVHNNCPYIL
jgi:uncharacterized protein YxjI